VSAANRAIRSGVTAAKTAVGLVFSSSTGEPIRLSPGSSRSAKTPSALSARLSVNVVSWLLRGSTTCRVMAVVPARVAVRRPVARPWASELPNEAASPRSGELEIRKLAPGTPATGLPLASFSVATMLMLVKPSDGTVSFDNTTVERLRAMAPARATMVPLMLASPATKVSCAVPNPKVWVKCATPVASVTAAALSGVTAPLATADVTPMPATAWPVWLSATRTSIDEAWSAVTCGVSSVTTVAPGGRPLTVTVAEAPPEVAVIWF